jgi:hypothetical protein
MGTKGDKGEEETTVAPAMAEIQALQSHIQRVEAMEQNQGLQLQVDLKSEMATSQSVTSQPPRAWRSLLLIAT